jgi:type IV pilus biogenesis protein CpaD/CtpE
MSGHGGMAMRGENPMRTMSVPRLSLAVALLSAVSGCSEYLDRKDTLLLGAGDAVETNIATHVADPWPAESRSRDFATSGERTQIAVERYRTRPQPSGASGGGLVNINVGAGGSVR